MPSVATSAASSDSTSRRSSSSPAQRWERIAACSSGRAASTASSVASTRCQRSGLSELTVEPRAGLSPVELDGAGGDVERLGDLLDRHAAEEAELDGAAEAVVELSQAIESLVELQHLTGALVRESQLLVEVQRGPAAAPLGGAVPPCV